MCEEEEEEGDASRWPEGTKGSGTGLLGTRHQQRQRLGSTTDLVSAYLLNQKAPRTARHPVSSSLLLGGSGLTEPRKVFHVMGKQDGLATNEPELSLATCQNHWTSSFKNCSINIINEAAFPAMSLS